MAREASIILNCICERKDIIFLLDILCDGGWNVFNEKGNIEYIPIGDSDDFCWQEDKISYEKLKEVIEVKQQKGELVGVNLFYEGNSHGISLLARDISEVIISIDINRKTVGNARKSLTDFRWYFSTIIMILHREDSFVFSYKFEDYID